MLCAAALIGCGPAQTCVEKHVGGIFCLGDSLLSVDQVLTVQLVPDSDTCKFNCASRMALSCEVARDAGLIELRVVGQVCQLPEQVACPTTSCGASVVECTIAGLPVGEYVVTSPGQPTRTRSLEVVDDGGSRTVCAL
jgi:hypothetical protein